MASGVETVAGHSTLRFQGMTESVAPMCPSLPANLARLTAFRPGPDQSIKRAGRKHAYSSSRRVPAGYSLIGLLASIARLRFTGTRNLTCTFHKPPQKGTFLLCQQGDISTLP